MTGAVNELADMVEIPRFIVPRTHQMANLRNRDYSEPVMEVSGKSRYNSFRSLRGVQDIAGSPAVYSYEDYNAIDLTPFTGATTKRGIPGSGDVDLLFILYNQNSYWFNGSSEEVFLNRESVYNLCFNIMGDSFSTLLVKYFSSRPVQDCLLDMFTDGILEVYKPDYPHLVPRYTADFHRGVIMDILGDRLIGYINRKPKIFTEAEIVSRFPVANFSTADFIHQCVSRHGFKKLVELLYYWYGTFYVQVDREKRLYG